MNRTLARGALTLTMAGLLAGPAYAYDAEGRLALRA